MHRRRLPRRNGPFFLTFEDVGVVGSSLSVAYKTLVGPELGPSMSRPRFARVFPYNHSVMDLTRYNLGCQRTYYV
jgi:hypothetical protein